MNENEIKNKDEVTTTPASTTEIVSTRPSKEHFEKNKTGSIANKKTFNNKRRTNQKPQRKQSEYQERVIDIARVTTVVKGGRRFSFSAVVIIGNKKGKVGIGHGKANEVPDAIKKAIKNAQSNLINVPIINKSTIPHEIKAKYLASHILLKPAPKGKGIVSSGTVRAVVELAGITDIYTKTYGSRTKQNIAKAAIKALSSLKTVEEIAELRDLSVDYLTSK